MARPRGTVDPNTAKLLQADIGQPPLAVEYPIRLTAQNSYLSGRAALVFVNPHLLIPADDTAVFGTSAFAETEGQAFWFTPPHEGACIVAWFHPPKAGTYNIDFSITGASGTYTLQSPEGTETTDIPAALELDWDKHLSTTFEAQSSKWLSFTLSGTMFWKLKDCELNLLP